MIQGSIPYVADGNITPSCFVQMSTSDNRVILSGAGDECVGISQPGTRRAPYASLNDGYAAIQGEELLVYGIGEICPLIIGAAVVRGDRLKSDANGNGTPAGTSDNAYAIATVSCSVVGATIPVQVIFDTVGSS